MRIGVEIYMGRLGPENICHFDDRTFYLDPNRHPSYMSLMYKPWDQHKIQTNLNLSYTLILIVTRHIITQDNSIITCIA